MSSLKGFQRKGDIVEVPREVEIFVQTQPGLLVNLYHWILFKAGKLTENEDWIYKNWSDERMWEVYGKGWASSVELMLDSLDTAHKKMNELHHVQYEVEQENE